MGKLFVWDFHGVLEKDNEYAVLEVVNRVLAGSGIKRKATLEECKDLYGKKWADYYQYFSPNSDEEAIHRMVEMALKISLNEKPALKYIKQNDFAEYVLKKIEEKGHTNVIMSNSSAKSLDFFLESVNLQNYFKYRFGADNHKSNYSKYNKIELLQNFIEGKTFDKIIVIDDIEDGIDMGLQLNAITYRFSSRKNQINSKAHYIISDLREILKEI